MELLQVGAVRNLRRDLFDLVVSQHQLGVGGEGRGWEGRGREGRGRCGGEGQEGEVVINVLRERP